MAAKKFWRLLCIDVDSVNGTFFSVAQLELLDTAGINRANISYGGVIASSEQSGYPAVDISDTSLASYWKSVNLTSQWIGWGFPAPVEIVNIRVGNRSLYGWDILKTFAPQHSDDGITWDNAMPGAGTLVNVSGTPNIITQFSLGGNLNAALSSSYSMVAYGGGNAQLTAGFSLQASGGGVAALTAPAARISASGGGNSAITSPAGLLTAVGHDSSGENDFSYTAPKPSLSAYGGANAALTSARALVSASGTATGWGTAALVSPAASLVSTGTVGAVGSAKLTLPGSFSLVGYGGALCAITISGHPTIAATGTSGAVGKAALTLPLYDLVATTTTGNYASASLIAPAARLGGASNAWLIAPSAQLVAIGTAVVAVTYEAYAVNLNHKGVKDPVDEVTRYTNFPFDRIVRYNNSYFGVSATGLYLLEGTTDHATPPAQIPWEFKTHLTDFENPKEKTVVSAYFGGRMGKAETITLYAGEKTTKAYKYKTTRGSTAQNHREKFGRGIKARYFAVGADGADVMELDNIEFNIHSLTRRI